MTDTPLSIHRPIGTPRGGIVVVQEAFGVNDHIEDVSRRFAAEGWLAVAPHLYHRQGDPQFGYDELSSVRPLMAQLTSEGILADIDSAIRFLAESGLGPSDIGIVGFCMGGSIALVVAAERNVGAAVTFYGGGVTAGRFGFPPLVDVAPRLRAPWLGLFGDHDHSISVDDVEQLRAAAAQSSTVTEVVRYGDAGHGFHCDQRGDYHAASAQDAWRRTQEWFSTHLGAVSPTG